MSIENNWKIFLAVAKTVGSWFGRDALKIFGGGCVGGCVGGPTISETSYVLANSKLFLVSCTESYRGRLSIQSIWVQNQKQKYSDSVDENIFQIIDAI